MKSVIEAVERIREFPDARIDCGVGQGPRVFTDELRKHFSDTPDLPLMPFEWYAAHTKQYLAELKSWVAPYELPEDYCFFLEYYGGLGVLGPEEEHWLNVYGMGPMTKEWYGYVMGDTRLFEKGFLRIALLVLYEALSGYVAFFLDLAGTIQQNGVIGVLEWTLGGLGLRGVLRDPFAHRSKWVLVAPSFTEWLEKVAETAGSLGFRSQDVP